MLNTKELDSTIAAAVAPHVVRTNDAEVAALITSQMTSLTHPPTNDRTFLSAFLRLSFIFDADYAPNFLTSDLFAEKVCWNNPGV
jgi:hypothetical protein